jgi:hypothetical protein
MKKVVHSRKSVALIRLLSAIWNPESSATNVRNQPHRSNASNKSQPATYQDSNTASCYTSPVPLKPLLLESIIYVLLVIYDIGIWKGSRMGIWGLAWWLWGWARDSCWEIRVWWYNSGLEGGGKGLKWLGWMWMRWGLKGIYVLLSKSLGK